VKIAIWTDNDLDGAGSAFLLKQLYDKRASEIFIKEVSDNELPQIKAWLEANYSKYTTIYISDLYIPDELVEDVDREKVVVIDHHKTHALVKDRFKKAKTIIEIETSCTKLIYNKFQKIFDEFITQPQRSLIDIVDDYDSYQLKYPETLKLNAVYRFYNRPKAEKFIENFSEGIRDFNVYELNSIKLYFNKLKDELNNTQYFCGTVKGYKVVSCFANFAINEVAHTVLKKFDADIAIIVISKANAVSFRKNGNRCSIDLSSLAEKLCDGGGHEYAAGGTITDNFLKFTQTLTLCS